jgi:hypothetical protein
MSDERFNFILGVLGIAGVVLAIIYVVSCLIWAT